jgi:ribonuclease HI
MGEYVLFFDGRSRANPGPGGAGAIVISVDKHCATSTLVWSAAMSLASPRTTNNQAEYLGLVTRLAAAYRHWWRPLSVVGDSQLINNQLRQYRPPKNNVLRRFYHSVRRLADGLGVTLWSHQLDAAANIAMDTHRSIQTHHPTARPEWAGLDQLSAGDFLHWQASILGDH